MQKKAIPWASGLPVNEIYSLFLDLRGPYSKYNIFMKQWIATSTCLYGSVSLKRLRYFWAAMITLSLEGQVPLDCLHPLLNAMLRQIQNVLFFCYRLILCPSFKEPFQWYNKISARGPGWNFEFHALSDISHAVIFS